MSDNSRGQGRVIALLKMQPEVTTGDMVYLLGISPQSLNTLLVKLEKNGIITRTPAEDDRRKVVVRLTEKGKNEPQEGAPFENLFDALSAEEQARLDEIIDKLIAALESTGEWAREDISEWIKEARERYGDKLAEMLKVHRGFSFAGCHGGSFGKLRE
jgi:DNA-binding MarR family transcriptional regulator